MIIYQMLPRLWGEGKFSSIGAATFEHVKSLGVNAIWYTGIIRHATGEPFVKGDAGSPYAISDYYDINPYLADRPDAREEEFEDLVRRTHDAGLKVIIDFVPNHVARNYDRSALPLFDHCDYDWTDTLKINYGAQGCWEKMTDILRFWAAKGVDGFRCDMVELVPADFLKYAICAIKSEFPGTIFIAEAYDRKNYVSFIDYVGFDLLYDKSGIYDALRGIVLGGWSARTLTWNWQFLGGKQSNMLNFLENHDEERFPLNGGFAPLAAAALFNTASFMIYFGEETGNDAAESDNRRTTIFNFARIDSLQRLYNYITSASPLPKEEEAYLHRFKDICALAATPVIASGDVHDLCYFNEGNAGFDMERHFAFLRYNDAEAVLVFCNFSACEAQLTLKVPDLGTPFSDTPVTVAPGEALIWTIRE